MSTIGAQLHKVPIDFFTHGLAVDPSGEKIVITRSSDGARRRPTILVWHRRSAERLYNLDTGLMIEECRGAAFDQNGTLYTLAYGQDEDSSPKRLWLLTWSVNEQPPIRHDLAVDATHYRHVAVSPNGTKIMLMGDDIRVFDHTSGTLLCQIPLHSNPLVGAVASFAPTNETFWIYGAQPGLIVEYRLDGSETGKRFDGPHEHGNALVVAVDGRTLAAVGGVGTFLIDIQTGRTVENFRFTSTSPPRWGGFTPDGKHYVYAGARLQWFNLQTGRSARGPKIELGQAHWAAYAYNESVFAFVMQDGPLVWGSASTLRTR